jgi:hypothetical protein
MREYFSAFGKTKKLFRRPRVFLVAIVSGTILFLTTLWLPNYRLIQIVLVSDTFSLSQKAQILITSLGSFQTSFTSSDRIFVLLTSVLGGMAIALLLWYMKNSFKIQKEAGMSILGILLSFIGVGCSACGSVIVSSIFGVSSTYWLTSVLPFGGLEFSIISTLILSGSLLYLSKKIQSPIVCHIKLNNK